MQPTEFLKESFQKLIAHAGAAQSLNNAMPKPPKGKTYVLAIGKAAAAMAAQFERLWPQDAPLTGVAITRYGHGAPTDLIEVIEASHPVPDSVGNQAAQRVVDQVSTLGEDDLFVCLISGGGSALFTLPAPGITPAEKQSVNKQLLASGLPINKMNCLRKHISAVKGGRLAALAHPARVHTVAISDVPGNDLSTIASGPTLMDTTTRQEALEIARSLPNTPQSVLNWLSCDAAETPKDPGLFAHHVAQVTVTPESAFEALVQSLEPQDIEVLYLGADLEGEAKELGAEHARLALEKQTTAERPVLILSGGETTVTLGEDSKHGRGGRNAEYLASLFTTLQGGPGIYALAADTDGIDGSEDNAGAFIAPQDWARARNDLGLNPQSFLDEHDSYSLFGKLDRLLITEPTRTNVNDFRAIYVEKLPK